MKGLTVTVAWTCPSCQALIVTPYCPECGERPLAARDLTFRGLVQQIFEAFTNIDGRLLRSFRHLIGRPGLLTVAFLQGRRRPYIGPVSLFLITNVLFFGTEALTGGAVFSTPLESHLETQPWSPLARVLVANRMDTLQTTVAQYAPRFDAAVALHARSLILLMALSFTAVPWLVFRRPRRPFMAHAAFSLHLYAFMLLALCLATTVPAFGKLTGGVRSTSDALDHVLSVALVVACGVYLYLAIGRVYNRRGGARFVAAAGLAAATAAIVLGYRFALLLLTLYRV